MYPFKMVENGKVKYYLFIVISLCYCVFLYGDRNSKADSSRVENEYSNALKELVLSVVKCENPLIVEKVALDKGVYLKKRFAKKGKLPLSFKKIELSDSLAGYRVRFKSKEEEHYWLFELKEKKLVLIGYFQSHFEIDYANIANGRYVLRQMIITGPESHKPVYFMYENGKYIKVK